MTAMMTRSMATMPPATPPAIAAVFEEATGASEGIVLVTPVVPGDGDVEEVVEVSRRVV